MGAALRYEPLGSVEAIRAALRQSVEQTLEIMCFAEATPLDAPPPCDGELVTARVDVRGDLMGTFHLGVCRDGARQMVCSFLARDDDAADADVRPVLCEMANIICGSMLTRLDPGACFTLLTPRAVENPSCADDQVEAAFAVDDAARLWCSFALDSASP